MGIDMCGSIMQCTVCGSIFTGPRCLWGPVYGSRSLYVTTRPLVETLLMFILLGESFRKVNVFGHLHPEGKFSE